jgi:hypothetical protein
MYHPQYSAPGRWNDWGHRGRAPGGWPLHGVVEIGDSAEYPSFSLGSDTTWLTIAPEGNQEGQPILSVGATFEATNPGWNTSLTYDTSAWSPAAPKDDIGIWGPGDGTPLYLRKVFSLATPVEDVVMLTTADDDAFVYINGELLVFDTDARASGFGPIDVTDYLIQGENLVAIKAHDSYGGAEYLSFHLFGTAVPEPSTLVLLAMGTIGLVAWSWRRRPGR